MPLNLIFSPLTSMYPLMMLAISPPGHVVDHDLVAWEIGVLLSASHAFVSEPGI